MGGAARGSPTLRLAGTGELCAFAGLGTHLRGCRFLHPRPGGGSGDSGRAGSGCGRGDRASNRLQEWEVRDAASLGKDSSPPGAPKAGDRNRGPPAQVAGPGAPRRAACRMRPGSSRSWKELLGRGAGVTVEKAETSPRNLAVFPLFPRFSHHPLSAVPLTPSSALVWVRCP